VLQHTQAAFRGILPVFAPRDNDLCAGTENTSLSELSLNMFPIIRGVEKPKPGLRVSSLCFQPFYKTPDANLCMCSTLSTITEFPKETFFGGCVFPEIAQVSFHGL